MKMFVALFVTLCVGVVLADLDTSNCRPVTPEPTYDFSTFINGEYRYEAGSNSVFMKNLVSAYLQTIQVEEIYYGVFSANLKDGTQQNRYFIITDHSTPMIKETELADGQTTEQDYGVIVYGGNGNFSQIYICGEKADNGDDIRFVLAKGQYKLTAADWKKVALNDKNGHFQGGLLRLGTGAKLSDNDE